MPKPHDISALHVLSTATDRAAPLSGIEAPAWMGDALCAQVDSETFFPEKGGSSRDAKRVCLRCPVRAECLTWALENEERYGVWGGYSERERRRLVRGQTVELCRICPGCGTTMPATARNCSSECRERCRRRRTRAAS